MKILYITNMFPTSSKPYSGIFILEQIEALKKYSSSIEARVVLIEGFKGFSNYLKSIFTINWHLMHQSYDIIHIHYGLSGLFLLFNPLVRTPIILTLHGGDININRIGFKFKAIRFISRKVCNRANKVVVVNPEMKNFINSKIDSIVIPCGIDTEVFYNKEKAKNISNKIVIGFPSDPSRPEKNYPLFKEIITLLKKDFEIETINFMNKSRDKVRECLNNLDLLLMTSFSEGSPQIVKEAMCCNISVISTNVGDVRKLLEGVKNSYVVDSFIAEDFILSIKKCLQVEELTNGREKIFSIGLDEKSISNDLFTIYKNLLYVK